MNTTRFVAAAVVFLALSLAAHAQVTPAPADNDAQIAQLKAQIAALEAAKAPVADGATAAAQAPDATPLFPLEKSDLVVKDAAGALMVADKSGKGVDGIKLSQHDTLIASPSIAVGPDGTIHVAFVEKHRTTFANAVYHRSSSDGGKTWTDARNLSEDMPEFDVGRCQVITDSKNRVYVIWRAAIAKGWSISPDPAGGSFNLWFRVLDGGNWSSIKPIGETCVQATILNAAFSSFAATDAAGRAQVLWNVMPDKWRPETLDHNAHSNGAGNGLVFQSTLDGASAGQPRQVFLPVVTPPATAWGSPSCDGLDTMNGYVDTAGEAHFVALAAMPMYGLPQHPAHYQLIENGKAGQSIELPDLSFHAARDIPTLLVDAKGKRHMIALFLAGEHPNIRDYTLGADVEPVVVRAAVGLDGTIQGFQAYQGPGGRMAVIMQMSETGASAASDNFISLSTGEGKWSTPVNVTDNAGRNAYVSRNTSSQSQLALQTGADPGPGAAAFDHDGHLLLIAVKEEFSIVHSVAFGVVIGGGGSKTPTLRFLRF